MSSELQRGEIVRVARIPHRCTSCGNTISIGKSYIDGSIRVGQYDDKDRQIGIHYWKYKVHTYDCTALPF